MVETILDTPKIGNYGASVPAESNSLCDQAMDIFSSDDMILFYGNIKVIAKFKKLSWIINDIMFV